MDGIEGVKILKSDFPQLVILMMSVYEDNERIFDALFEGYYKSEFGRIEALRLNVQESAPDPDYALLVYDARCEKVPLAKVSVTEPTGESAAATQGEALKAGPVAR